MSAQHGLGMDPRMSGAISQLTGTALDVARQQAQMQQNLQVPPKQLTLHSTLETVDQQIDAAFERLKRLRERLQFTDPSPATQPVSTVQNLPLSERAGKMQHFMSEIHAELGRIEGLIG